MSTNKKEARRQRGEIACAECRRLKVRCSKTIPCETCVKRGTAALCPNGTIPPGDGSRFVLAAEDHLRRKMTKLEERMHALEDALAIVQATESKNPHPLLSQPFSLDEDDDDLLEEEEEEDTKTIIGTSGLADAFGALHMENNNGASQRFFGPSGGSESLLLKAKDLDPHASQPFSAPSPQDIDASYLPREITLLYESFPLSPLGVDALSAQAVIESFLPSMSRATALCETLLGNMTWMFSIVSNQHIIGELIPAVYSHLRIPSTPRTYGPHDLALLLIVIGIGALVDLSLPPYHPEAQHYYRLARAAIGLQSVLTHRSVVTVKCLHLMSIYNGMSGKESNLENSYSLLNFAGQIALAIGFHMDPSHFGFEGREAYERRAYFYHLLQPILWQSLVTGRPTISGKFIDCRIPSAEEEYTYEQGEAPLGFGIWSSKFTIECLLPVAEATLAANPPTYRTILELDERVRKFDVPIPALPPGATQQPASTMQRFVREHYRELTLLFLHRGCFAQALTDNPTNPQQSIHGQSFITAFKCACAILDSTIGHFNQQPQLTPRVWRIWSNAFSAAVIIGTVAVHNPDSKLDPPPFEKLDQACILFHKAAETSSRAQRALPILVRMRQKARQGRHTVPSHGITIKPGYPHVEPYDELAIFGGRAGLVMPTRSSQPSSNLSTPEPIRIPSIPNLHPPPQTNSRSGDFYSPDDQILQDLFREQPPPTSGGLPSNWENLYREIPEPSFSHGFGNTHMDTGAVPRNSLGEGVMLEDRWSSFMHQYGMLGQVQLPPQSHF